MREPEAQTFVETALKLGGKSEEEARTTGALDRADDQVEALFAARYQTANSPVHRAVWDREAPIDLFAPEPPQTLAARASGSCSESLDGRPPPPRRRDACSAPDGKIAEAVLDELAEAGYWGLLIDPRVRRRRGARSPRSPGS